MIKVSEHTSASYAPRTYHNASRADITVAFAVDFETAGERLTRKAAGSRYVSVDLALPILEAARLVFKAVKSIEAKTVNIAGNGIYTLSKHGWDQDRANRYVLDVLAKVHEHWPLEMIVSGGQTGIDLAGGVAGVCLDVDVEMLLPLGFKQRHEDKIDRDHTQVEILEQLEKWVRDLEG